VEIRIHSLSSKILRILASPSFVSDMIIMAIAGADPKRTVIGNGGSEEASLTIDP